MENPPPKEITHLLESMHDGNDITMQDRIICKLLLQADQSCDSELAAFALAGCQERLQKVL